MTRNKGGKSTIVRFVSAGGISQSAFTGNQFKLLSITGSPWDGGQDGAYGFDCYRMQLRYYFADSIFEAYDYFRVVNCETTIRWRSAPLTGPIMGDLYTYIDKDADQLPQIIEVANRRELKRKSFTNECQTHEIHWQPYVISREGGGSSVDYVQPRERWLNTKDVANFRFGSLVILATTPNATTQYGQNDAAISIRHKITIEVKGQKTLQRPGENAGVTTQSVTLESDSMGQAGE